MKIIKLFVALIFVFLIALIASSCGNMETPPESDLFPTAEAIDSPGESEDQPSPVLGEAEPANGVISDDLPPQAAIVVLQMLADRLEISPGEIEILSSKQTEWSDSCLGLGGPAESCLAVITPGWQIVLRFETRLYAAHTDALGDSVRFEDQESTKLIAPPLPSESDGSVPEAAVTAQELLADRLGIAIEKVTIVSYEYTEWPDGCLGISSPGVMCTMAIVPGWRVELSADGQSFIARTDETGRLVKFE